ncbi:MAG TPA: hypothetical protein VHC39_08900 [Rhizomicrobium sp.]|nr:hypothetical protein [Rhizomicrobium sp.]
MKLLRWLIDLFVRRGRSSDAERWCAEYFRSRKPARLDQAAPLVVIEAVDDLFFHNLLGEVVIGLREQRAIRVARWASNSFAAGASLSLRSLAAAQLHKYLFSRMRWGRLYDGICDLPGDRADRTRAPWVELACLWHAWRLFRGVSSKDQLAALTVDGILVGDLVIDTYLRFRPAIEVQLQDPYLFWVLRQALRDMVVVRKYFRRVRPALYLSTYTTYVQHGIPVRTAVAMGITAWSFANAQEFGTRLTKDHPLQSRRCAGYAADFARLGDQDEKLAMAGELLGGRVAGIADMATSLMRSAYQIRTQDVPDVRGAAVVFLHDFYDSPHIYRWMVFQDFWDWACATIEILQGAGLPFVLKPHPSQRAESSRELERLKHKYPGVRFVSSDVSNRQLVDGGMACAVTVYGSVAAEMAYMGVPSISCGDNPHASFDAFHLARDREEYSRLLSNFVGLPRDCERLRRQACAFYYMHNMNATSEALELRDRMIEFHGYMIKKLEVEKAAFSPDEMAKIFAGLEGTAGFRNFVVDLAAELNGAPAPCQISPEGAKQCLSMPRF